MSFEKREGEVSLPFDPAEVEGPTVAFIGKIHSPWQKDTAPHNLTQARERGGEFHVQLEADYRPALTGLSEGDKIILLYWMDQARRDLVLQAPRHSKGPRGTFSLRSPVRPNPIALAVVSITSLDIDAGRIGIDAIDCFDGTPLVDIKPWIARVDAP